MLEKEKKRKVGFEALGEVKIGIGIGTFLSYLFRFLMRAFKIPFETMFKFYHQDPGPFP